MAGKKKLPKAVQDYIREITRRGGKARAQRMTPEQRREQARKAALARWSRGKKKAPSVPED